MLRAVIRALPLVLLIASGCGQSKFRAQEGTACSTDPSDDPLFVCTPADDLVCIATYRRPVTNPALVAQFPSGSRPIYVCRLNCNVTAECPVPGEVCCRGTIYGKTYGKAGGCVPATFCEETTEPEPDAGTSDTAPRADSATPKDGRSADAPTMDGADDGPGADSPSTDGGASDGGASDSNAADTGATDTGAADGSTADGGGPSPIDANVD